MSAGRNFMLLFFIITLSSSHSFAQDLVKHQGITSVLHRNNIGKIIFTDRSISTADLNEQQFLKQYKLTNNSNLFFTVFMDNSMTNYLHRLAPVLSADSLVKLGNYQFSFFVDDSLIHISNLLPGAPRPRLQDTVTAFTRPLIDTQQEGVLWSQYLWGRFMRNGGDSALTDGKHLLGIEVRPYIRLGNEIRQGDIIAAGKLSLQVYRNPEIDISGIHLSQPKPYPGFGISNEKFDDKKIRELVGKIEEGVFKKITSLVIINNAKLQIEEYFNNSGRDSLHNTRSVGKSFASSMTGIAIGENYLKNEDQRLKEFYSLKNFANYSIQKEEVTISDLLTMSSVFDGDDNEDTPGNEENMYPTDNWVKFALDLPVNFNRPKEQWHYFTAGVVVLGDILHKSVPEGLEKYADKKLFRQMGITGYRWQFTPQGVANTAGGLQLRSLDLAKYGQLYKNGGSWKGVQLIPKTWVEKTFSRQRTITGTINEYYGYLFWNKTYRVNNRNYETWYCTGNGGNKIFIFKDQPWVIVITATAYGQPYAHPQVDRMMIEYIIPALTAVQR